MMRVSVFRSRDRGAIAAVKRVDRVGAAMGPKPATHDEGDTDRRAIEILSEQYASFELDVLHTEPGIPS
jgi:hypothetical protein